MLVTGPEVVSTLGPFLNKSAVFCNQNTNARTVYLTVITPDTMEAIYVVPCTPAGCNEN